MTKKGMTKDEFTEKMCKLIGIDLEEFRKELRMINSIRRATKGEVKAVINGIVKKEQYLLDRENSGIEIEYFVFYNASNQLIGFVGLMHKNPKEEVHLYLLPKFRKHNCGNTLSLFIKVYGLIRYGKMPISRTNCMFVERMFMKQGLSKSIHSNTWNLCFDMDTFWKKALKHGILRLFSVTRF